MPAKKAPAKKKAAKNAVSESSISASNRKDELRWRAESDLRTLTEAEELKKDKGRMGRVAKLAQEQIKTAKKFTGKFE